MAKFLHDLPDFKQLIAVVSDAKGIAPTLIEKNFWIMHCPVTARSGIVSLTKKYREVELDLIIMKLSDVKNYNQ